MVKEEIEDDLRQLEPTSKYSLMDAEMEDDDELIAQYNISSISSDKYRCMSVTGLKDVLVRTRDLKVHLRVDQQEFKITAKTLLDDSPTAWTSKQTNHLLDTQAFLFRLPIATFNNPGDTSGGGGHNLVGAANHHHQQQQSQHIASFVPITSQHLLTFLEREQRAMKMSDEESKCHEDVFMMPSASRNKHQQLTIEMKTRVYKTVERIKLEDRKAYDKFMDELFTRRHGGKVRQLTETGVDNDDKVGATSISSSTVIDTYQPYADILSCPHWQMGRLNLSDIRRLDDDDLQIQALLRKGQVMTYAEMREILTVESATLVNSLPIYALLIFGNWVVKSHLLYQVDVLKDSEATQQHYRDLIAARDYLLWTLVTRRGTTFAELYPKFNKTPDHEEILKKLTIRHGLNEPLSFVLPEDTDFLRTNIPGLLSIQKNTLKQLERHKSYGDK